MFRVFIISFICIIFNLDLYSQDLNSYLKFVRPVNQSNERHIQVGCKPAENIKIVVYTNIKNLSLKLHNRPDAEITYKEHCGCYEICCSAFTSQTLIGNAPGYMQGEIKLEAVRPGEAISLNLIVESYGNNSAYFAKLSLKGHPDQIRVDFKESIYASIITPYKNDSFPCGYYKCVLSAKNFRDSSLVMEVEPDKINVYEFKLQPAYGTLKLKYPKIIMPQAELYIDERKYVFGRDSSISLPPGDHVVQVINDGCILFNQFITILDHTIKEVYMDIMQLQAVELNITPSNAKVMIDDKYVDLTKKIELKKGEHRITISKEGYKTKTDNFSIKKLDNNQFKLKYMLESLEASIRIFTIPDQVMITIGDDRYLNSYSGKYYDVSKGKQKFKIEANGFYKKKFSKVIRKDMLIKKRLYPDELIGFNYLNDETFKQNSIEIDYIYRLFVVGLGYTWNIRNELYDGYITKEHEDFNFIYDSLNMDLTQMKYSYRDNTGWSFYFRTGVSLRRPAGLRLTIAYARRHNLAYSDVFFARNNFNVYFENGKYVRIDKGEYLKGEVIEQKFDALIFGINIPIRRFSIIGNYWYKTENNYDITFGIGYNIIVNNK